MHQQVRHEQPHEQKNQRQQRVSPAPSSETSQTPPNKQHCPNHRGKVQYAALADLPPANKRVSTTTGYDAGDTVGGACAGHDDSACAGHYDSAALDDEGTFADAALIYDEQDNRQDDDRQNDDRQDDDGWYDDRQDHDRQDDGWDDGLYEGQDDDAGDNNQDDWNAMLNENFDIHDELWYEVRPPRQHRAP